jgi:hypothetical protein
MKLPRNELNGWIVASVPAPVNGRIGKHVYQGWTPCMRWCAEHFEQHNWRFVSEGVFEFRRADDHLMFMLKWS